jgi:16S rRNA (guanine(966)-N(2))-methyltransferase RsmD
LRIIAGEFRGRTLIPPKNDKTTRPITDRAKQSLFDILSHRIACSVVFDCFCGTGSMGLECLSRGADRVFFFDADRSALTRLKQNIQSLGVARQSRVVPGDIFRTIRGIEEQADLIFLDPPYRLVTDIPDRLKELARQLSQRCNTRNGQLIFRHDVKDYLSLPGWERIDHRNYGSMTIEILQPVSVSNTNAD